MNQVKRILTMEFKTQSGGIVPVVVKNPNVAVNALAVKEAMTKIAAKSIFPPTGYTLTSQKAYFTITQEDKVALA